jgi:hypothetical protein
VTLFSYVIPSDDTLLSAIELRPSIRERYSCPRLCINSIHFYTIRRFRSELQRSAKQAKNAERDLTFNEWMDLSHKEPQMNELRDRHHCGAKN